MPIFVDPAPDERGQLLGSLDVQRRGLRWVLLHVLEETARHAGHADIFREELDGARAPQLEG